jgi:hypothetical protein
LTIPYFVGKDKELLYLTVPFTMPANMFPDQLRCP